MSKSGDIKRTIVVLGAGVIGLTTANVLQQQLKEEAEITIVADEFPYDSPTCSETPQNPSPSANYASMWAGAHYRPIPFIAPSHSEYAKLSGDIQRFHAQLAFEHLLARRTVGIMKHLATSNPETGIQVVSAEEYLERPPVENQILRSGEVYASTDDSFRVLEAHELEKLNRKLGRSACEDVRWGCEYESYVVNVHIYCRWLLHKFIARGGRIVQQRVNSLAEVLSFTGSQGHTSNSTAMIINCTGQGTGLAADPSIRPIRGQTVLVKQQYHATKTRQCVDGTWSFLIPRPLGGGTIIGGTKQIGDAEDQPRAEERQRLLENAAKYFPDFVDEVSKFEVVQDNVGRRPWREGGLRIEIDKEDGEEGPTIIHGYGAGGRGYELSWGIAEEIYVLVEKICALRSKL